MIGLGETYAGYFFPESLPGIVEFFAPILTGQSPDDVEVLWPAHGSQRELLAPRGLGMAVINAIEAALWDLPGKMNGVPVYQMPGGLKHERLPRYASGGPI